MKRYSVSRAYGRNRENGKISFQYDGRTDNVEVTKEQYKKGLDKWIKKITDENYEYRCIIDDYYGIRITDSKTKEIVFEDAHIAEEYGWKKEYIKIEGSKYYRSTDKWLKV